MKQGSTKSDAHPRVDLQLVALIQSWPTLSKETQQQIMRLLGRLVGDVAIRQCFLEFGDTGVDDHGSAQSKLV